MKARFILVLILVAGLLAGPGAGAFCPVPTVRKACCKCCETSGKPCGMATQPKCATPVLLDGVVQSDSNPVSAPQPVAILPFIQFSAFDSGVRYPEKAELIPGPPPLELNCIRLI